MDVNAPAGQHENRRPKMEKTTRITDAELQGLLEKWALPAIAEALVRAAT